MYPLHHPTHYLTVQTSISPTRHQATPQSIHIAQRPRSRRKQLITRDPVLTRWRHDIQPLQIRRLASRTIRIHPVCSSCVDVSGQNVLRHDIYTYACMSVQDKGDGEGEMRDTPSYILVRLLTCASI